MGQSYVNQAPQYGVVTVDDISIGSNINNMTDVTVKEIVLAESLTVPTLQTSVTLQSKIYGNQPKKNFSEWKNQDISISLSSKTPKVYQTMRVNQKIYRMQNREMVPINVGQTEEFSVHACDQTLLNDAKSLVSKSWKCKQPSDIVSYVLKSCVGAQQAIIENSSGQGRDYIAENVHPFQVIQQQANVALASGNDPSFVHFMTYDPGTGNGIHHFESLKKLCSKTPGSTKTFWAQGETGRADAGRYLNKNVAISFAFPCDFDYLSDLLNGLDENGQNQNTLTTVNPLSAAMSALGNQSMGCGIGGFNHKIATTNQGTAQQQNSCNVDVEQHLLKRQARMGLLEKDKVALRLVVPWNPQMHAGDTILFQWLDKTGGVVYGHGTYLVSSLMHTIKLGGFSTTTMDCISNTALRGG